MYELDFYNEGYADAYDEVEDIFLEGYYDALEEYGYFNEGVSDFLKKHKKKLIAAGILAGGGALGLAGKKLNYKHKLAKKTNVPISKLKFNKELSKKEKRRMYDYVDDNGERQWSGGLG